MGYYTEYSLDVKGIKNEEKFNRLVEAMEEKDLIRYAFDDGDYSDGTASFLPYGEAKWYGHEQDMIDISRQFPDMVFCLEGVGEQNDDMWKRYFKNGKCELCKAEIVFPEPEVIPWNGIH